MFSQRFFLHFFVLEYVDLNIFGVGPNYCTFSGCFLHPSLVSQQMLEQAFLLFKRGFLGILFRPSDRGDISS